MLDKLKEIEKIQEEWVGGFRSASSAMSAISAIMRGVKVSNVKILSADGEFVAEIPEATFQWRGPRD